MPGKPYRVQYAPFNSNPRKMKWGVLDGVMEDDILPTGTHRVFVTAQSERFEIPMAGMVFMFGRERQLDIMDRRAAEAKPQ